MPQLRHVLSFGGRLNGAYLFPDMHMHVNEVVLKKLQTLLMVRNLKLGEDVVNRIPNIIMLDLYCDETSIRDGGDDYYCFNNLSRLQKLETLSLTYLCNLVERTRAHSVTFPYSLKELTLKGTKLHWEEMQTKIGPLPLLQVLHLNVNSCIGSEWETFEGQFRSLRFLLIDDCADLEHWMTDDTHFPRLVDLHLRSLHLLKEIPLSIGDIPTLRSIKLECCSRPAVDSARRIQEEQETLDNEELQVQIQFFRALFTTEKVRVYD